MKKIAYNSVLISKEEWMSIAVQAKWFTPKDFTKTASVNKLAKVNGVRLVTKIANNVETPSLQLTPKEWAKIGIDSGWITKEAGPIWDKVKDWWSTKKNTRQVKREIGQQTDRAVNDVVRARKMITNIVADQTRIYKDLEKLQNDVMWLKKMDTENLIDQSLIDAFVTSMKPMGQSLTQLSKVIAGLRAEVNTPYMPQAQLGKTPQEAQAEAAAGKPAGTTPPAPASTTTPTGSTGPTAKFTDVNPGVPGAPAPAATSATSAASPEMTVEAQVKELTNEFNTLISDTNLSKAALAIAGNNNIDEHNIEASLANIAKKNPALLGTIQNQLALLGRQMHAAKTTVRLTKKS